MSQKVCLSVTSVLKVMRQGRIVEAMPRLSDTTIRKMIGKARNGHYTACQLRDNYAPAMSVRRIQQVLEVAIQLRRARMEGAPDLTARHKEARHK